MFHKQQPLSSTEEAELKIAKEEILKVSTAKPLGYLEKGIYKGKIINPRCIRYVPEELIDRLMTKKDIYILSPKYDGEKKVEWKGTQAKNPHIILLEKKEALAGNHTMVFHKAALKNLLELNKLSVLSMLNREKFFEDVKKGIKPTKENSFQTIDDSVVIAFVELVGRKDFTYNPKAKALVDAAFADTNLFFQNGAWRNIQLTKELSENFMREQFPQWVNVDWNAIVKEYKEVYAFMRSSESKTLVKNVISQLAKGHIDLHFIDEINQYIKKHPERRLSQIIQSKMSNQQEVDRKFQYR